MESRRTFVCGLIGAPALGLSSVSAVTAPAEIVAADLIQTTLRQAKGTQLVLLGTGAGPTPGRSRRMTSHLMLSNGAAYVLDCGLGVTDQYARTGTLFSALRSVFLTHQHPDHNIEYGPLLVIGWTQRMPNNVRAYGPPPLKQMTADFLNAYRTTLDFWTQEFHTPALTAIEVHEVSAAGPVMQDENVKVSAIIVEHPPVKPALGYRFDFKDRSLAFSGDTTPLESVAAMAKGADVLVHEAMYTPAVQQYFRDLLGPVPPALLDGLIADMKAAHSAAEDVGRIAQEAQVKTLVLSHLFPAVDSIPDELWREAAAKYFKGNIVVARDMTIV
jgi:ribonuclease BN (tRNA processing enzyme)